MPKKQTQESPKDQAERFRKAVQDMVDAGELSPIEAEVAFLRVVDASRVHPSRPNERPLPKTT